LYKKEEERRSSHMLTRISRRINFRARTMKVQEKMAQTSNAKTIKRN
jgi:hypothetical protein